MKIKVDKDKCIGCGLCVSIAEKAFELNDEGKVAVLETEEDEKLIEDAIESCPVGAIKREE